MRTSRQVVVVGNGMAGARLATELAARPAGDPVRVRVTVFGDEPEPAYNRVLLSQVLAGNLPAGDTALPAPAGRTVDVHTGHRVVAIRPDRRIVAVRSRPGVEQEIGYDHLVLATGGRAIVPRLRGLDPDRLPDRVAVFRTLADCLRILAVADQARTALVLGGG
ncbi:MAG: FAD-dependent oxidoreductase, partial [Natronosporangium sp.]